MRSAALAFMFVVMGGSAATADDTCRAQASENKLRGEELKSFLQNCKTVVQMVCDGRAIDQKVSDAAKDDFTKQCVKDGVGR
jgi:hypothetical protein